jgi:pyrroline-5-carboxylate reductase
MSAKSVGFIGGGRVARVILGGWQRAGQMPAEVVVSEPDAAAVEQLKARFPAVRHTLDAPGVIGRMERIFVAVHPPALLDALQPLAGHLRPDAVVVSLAPKVPIARLVRALGGFERIARAIPNAPSLVGAGYNPVAFGPGLGERERESVLELLGPLGACPVVPEEHLEAYAVLTAMGPTYLWFQIQQLRELGASFGLSGEAVDQGLEAMIVGTAKTLFASGLSAQEVIDLVPVKPLHQDEENIRAALKARLSGMFQKLKG